MESKVAVHPKKDSEGLSDDEIRHEVNLFSQHIAKLPNSGGPLTLMERTVLFAYLRHKLKE